MRWIIRILAVVGVAVFVAGLAIHLQGGLARFKRGAAPASPTSPAPSATGAPRTVNLAAEPADQEITEPVPLETFLRDHASDEAARELGIEELADTDSSAGGEREPPPPPLAENAGTAAASPVSFADASRRTESDGSSPSTTDAPATTPEPADDPLLALARAMQRGGRSELAARTSSRGARPHLLLVVIEDLNREDLGAYGQSLVATPFLDELAARGLRLTQCAASASGHTVARTALWYGGLPGEQRTEQGPIVRLARPTLPVALRRAGYATLLLGDGSWTTEGAGEAGRWTHWFGWRECGPEGPVGSQAQVLQDGEVIDLPSGEAGSTTRFDDVLTAGAAQLLSETPSGAAIAVVATVPLSWWQHAVSVTPAAATAEWTDQERRHAAAVQACDTFIAGLHQHLNSVPGGRSVAVVVVGLPRAKKAKGLNRFRSAVPALNAGIPKAAWPYAPVIVSWPENLPEGRVVTRFAGLQNLLPTLLEMTGRSGHGLEGGGESLWRNWTGDARD